MEYKESTPKCQQWTLRNDLSWSGCWIVVDLLKALSALPQNRNPFMRLQALRRSILSYSAPGAVAAKTRCFYYSARFVRVWISRPLRQARVLVLQNRKAALADRARPAVLPRWDSFVSGAFQCLKFSTGNAVSWEMKFLQHLRHPADIRYRTAVNLIFAAFSLSSKYLIWRYFN